MFGFIFIAVLGVNSVNPTVDESILRSLGVRRITPEEARKLKEREKKILEIAEFWKDSVSKEDREKLRYALDTLEKFMNNIDKALPVEAKKELAKIPKYFPYTLGFELEPDEQGYLRSYLTVRDGKGNLVLPQRASLKGGSKSFDFGNILNIFNFESCFDISFNLKFFHETEEGNPGYGLKVKTDWDNLDISLEFWGNVLKTDFWMPALIAEATTKPHFVILDQIIGDSSVSQAILGTIDRINRNYIQEAIGYLVNTLNRIIGSDISPNPEGLVQGFLDSVLTIIGEELTGLKNTTNSNSPAVAPGSETFDFYAHVISFNPDSIVAKVVNQIDQWLGQVLDTLNDEIIRLVVDALTSGGGEALVPYIQKVMNVELETSVKARGDFPGNIYILCTEGIVVMKSDSSNSIRVPVSLPATLVFAWNNRFNIYPGAVLQSIIQKIGAVLPIPLSTLLTAPESPFLMFFINYGGLLVTELENAITGFPFLITLESISAIRQTLRDIDLQLHEDINLNVNDVVFSYTFFRNTRFEKTFRVRIPLSTISSPVVENLEKVLNWLKGNVVVPLYDAIAGVIDRSLSAVNQAVSNALSSLGDIFEITREIANVVKETIGNLSKEYTLGANAPAFPLSGTQELSSDLQASYSAMMKALYLFYTIGYENDAWTLFGNRDSELPQPKGGLKVYRGWWRFGKSKDEFRFQFARPLKLGQSTPGCHVLDPSALTWENLTSPVGAENLDLHNDFAMVLWRHYYTMTKVTYKVSLRELLNEIVSDTCESCRDEAKAVLYNMILCPAARMDPLVMGILDLLGIKCGEGPGLPRDSVILPSPGQNSRGIRSFVKYEDKSTTQDLNQSLNRDTTQLKKNFAFYGRSSGGSGGKDWIRGSNSNTTLNSQINTSQSFEPEVVRFGSSSRRPCSSCNRTNTALIRVVRGGRDNFSYNFKKTKIYKHTVKVIITEDDQIKKVNEFVFLNRVPGSYNPKELFSSKNTQLVSFRKYVPQGEEKYELRSIIRSLTTDRDRR